MSEPSDLSGFSNVWFRLRLLPQAVGRRIELWRLERTVKSLQRDITQELGKLEHTWSRWETVKPTREKEKIRKSLSRIEQWLLSRTDMVDDRLLYLRNKQHQFRAITRWLWRGSIDDRDGDPNRILERDEKAD